MNSHRVTENTEREHREKLLNNIKYNFFINKILCELFVFKIKAILCELCVCEVYK